MAMKSKAAVGAAIVLSTIGLLIATGAIADVLGRDPIEIQIRVTGSNRLDKQLMMEWRLSNNGKKPICKWERSSFLFLRKLGYFTHDY